MILGNRAVKTVTGHIALQTQDGVISTKPCCWSLPAFTPDFRE